MKIRILAILMLLPAWSVIADEPGDAAANTDPTQRPTNSAVSRAEGNLPDEAKTKQKMPTREERRLLLMERELKRIGITEEEKVKVNQLQEHHKRKMSANAERIAAAREKLARLMDKGAPMNALEAAIDEIAAAQAEQLRILVYNRIEMERILGKEKYDEFMNNARKQFQKHGRRGGPQMPPRPGLPPIPGQSSGPDSPQSPPRPEKTGP